MPIKPRGNRVLVQLLKKEKKSSIVVSEDLIGNDRIVVGSIVEFGDTLFKKGTKVLFNRYRSNEFKDGEESYLIVEVDDILAYAD